MNNVKEPIIVAFTFVGAVIGAGFVTGQEIFQFFTSHGIYSIGGIFITGFILALGGIFVLNIGFRLKSQNHSKSTRYYLHPTIAKLFDIILTVFLFSLVITMTAGEASTINENFGLPFWLSSFILVILILITLFLKFDRPIVVLGGVTPFLVAAVVMVAVYYSTTGDLNFSDVSQYSNQNKSILPGWRLNAINYASLQIAVTFSFSTVMGGKLRYQSPTIYGGLIGGTIMTLLLLLINSGLAIEFNQIKEVALPSLLFAKQISPSIGIIMSVTMVLVIYNTVVGSMYTFTSCFSRPFTKRYYILIVVTVIITFAYIFVGSISLIGKVFPIMGLFGFILLIPMIYKGILWK